MTSDFNNAVKALGEAPPAPPWGSRPVGPSPALAARLSPEPGAEREVAVVLGAGGALGPDIVRGLRLRGTGAVVGADRQLTYPVEGAVYRDVDVSSARELRRLFEGVERAADGAGLVLGPVVDLSTVQTSPNEEADRRSLERGKHALAEVMCERAGDVRLFYMSTAEVYGSPEGAPYREDHAKEPFNAYGREKLREEETLLGAHGRRTRGGTLHVVALRSWTICMVETDAGGRVVETRNYNDPIVAVAERLSRIGVRVPVVDPSLRAQFHLGEEVTEVAVRLACAAPGAPTWGRAFNCSGRAATHGEIRDAAYDVFAERPQPAPRWAPLLRRAVPGRLPRSGILAAAQLLERLGGLAGARDVGARLPFLYRSTDLDSSALRGALGDRLTAPEGGSTVEAVQRLALGLRDGGAHAVNQRRYHLY